MLIADIKKIIKLTILLFAGFFLFLTHTSLASSKSLTVGIIEDCNHAGNIPFLKLIKKEVNTLSKAAYDMHFPDSLHYKGNSDKIVIKEAITQLLENPQADIIFSMGPISSRLLAELYPLKKPVVAWGIEFPVLTGLLNPKTLKPANPNWTTSYNPSLLSSTVIMSRRVFDFKKITYICPSFYCDDLSPVNFSKAAIRNLQSKGILVIKSTTAEVFAAPADNQPVIDAVHQGQKFQALEIADNWVKIPAGWIKNSAVTLKRYKSPERLPLAIHDLQSALSTIADQLGFSIEVVTVSPRDFPGKIKNLETNMVYVGQLWDFSESDEETFYQALIENKIPSVTQQGKYGIKKGALTTINDIGGTRSAEIFARKLDQIARGRPVSDIPVIDPWQIDLIFNPVTAKKINFDIPIIYQLEGRLFSDTNKLVRLNLETAVQKSLRENYEILIDQLEQKQVGILSDKSRTSYLPQITANYTLTETEDTATTGTAQITLSQNLFNAEANATMDMADHSKVLAAQNSELIKEGLIEDIIVAYLDILRLQEAMQSRTTHLRYFRKLKQTVQFRYNVRSSSRSDILRVDIEFKNGRFEMINSMEEFHRAKVTLNTILKQDMDTDVSLDPGFFSINPLIERERLLNKYRKPSHIKALQQFLIQQALNHSSQIKLAVAQLDQVGLEKQQAIGKFLPTLQMGISWSETAYIDSLTLSGDAERDYLDNNDLSWNAQIQLSIPLFNRGARIHDIKETNVKIQEMAVRVAKAKSDLGQAIKLLLHNHLMNHDRTLEIYGILESANKNLALAKISYEEGIITLKELLELQSSTIVASINATATKFQFYKSLVKLMRMVGRIDIIYLGLDHPKSKQFFKEMTTYIENSPPGGE